MDYAIITDVGGRRVNEDSVLACRNEALDIDCFAVADGLGGHGNGDLASHLVLSSIEAYIASLRKPEANLLERCIDGAQLLLRREMLSRDMPHIRTTLVLLLVCGGNACWAHVGDSRLYAYRRGRLLGRTRDHSVSQMLFDHGEITEDDMRHHPTRNRLLRAMGEEWDDPWYDIDETSFSVNRGDRFLLCSDGFWEWIGTKKMTRILRRPLSADRALTAMTKTVLKAGAGSNMDNYSAILVKY